MVASTDTSSGAGTAPVPGEFLPGEIVEAVALAGANSVGMQPSTLANIELGNFIQNTNQAQENEVSFQQTLDGVQATVLGKVVTMLTTLGPLASMSAQQILTGNSVAEELGALQATVAAFAQGGVTPPPNGGGPIARNAPGWSAEKPITVGTLRLNPPAGVTMNVYIGSYIPGTLAPPSGRAPAYTVTSGNVYVYSNGPAETVNIVFGATGNSEVAGTVNVIVRQQAS